MANGTERALWIGVILFLILTAGAGIGILILLFGGHLLLAALVAVTYALIVSLLR